MVEQPSVSPDLPKASLLEAFGANLEFGKELAPLTSFKTGGQARYFISARESDDIVRAVKAARRLSIPWFIMGDGSNLLVSDVGFDGLVVRVKITGLTLISATEIRSGAGEALMSLVDFATANSLTGLEFAAGIWGSVGGAVYGNAGAFGGEIGSVVSNVTLVDRQGKVKRVAPGYCKFSYRHSHLKESGDVIVAARFKLRPADSRAIQGRVDEILSQRSERHPQGALSAGCFFRNIPDPAEKHGKIPAGRMLEEIGAKELSVGGAKVFEKHANIIVNSGNATSKDIRQLADILKDKVYKRFGVELKEEVQQLGEF